ncbi:uncharacterized protein LOC126967654 [Leptidea sinapis]|uniref:uncharacterized protein LOC126967654 n=1 Tax=Leptidea sinapis TaxID=189913 RepID=UPI0021C451F3|nr:uncharacterized protein LOC126967654 [Leptidea sinapis]
MNPVYHWKLGDIALARICKKVYGKVQVIKDKDGLFFDEKVLGTTKDGEEIMEELCYYVEIIRSKQQIWLPYTSMFLAERHRPFYGTDRVIPKKSPQEKPVPRKRKIKEDHILPLSVRVSNSKEPDLNISYEIRQAPMTQGKYANAFKEFVRCGKEQIFDSYLTMAKQEEKNDILEYLHNVDASTEDKFEMVIRNNVTVKEIENYLHHCWRYCYLNKHTNNKETLDYVLEKQQVSVHIPWCLVCGQNERLRECVSCPASYHVLCRREWLVSIIHRKNPPKKEKKQVTLIHKILSSTRTKSSIEKDKENLDLCPSCMWGPSVGYDDVVWHKLGTCSWWPARVLTPGATPSCLLTRTHSPHQWPLKYYGTLNHSWGDTNRMCLFLPKHTAALEARDETLRKAVLDACDDYISVYLT